MCSSWSARGGGERLAAGDRADLIVHLIRNTFRLASRRDWDGLKRHVKPIYTAVNAATAHAALDDLAERWGQRYAAIRLWENTWEEFIRFLDYDIAITQVLCSINAIESLNARRSAVRDGRTLSTVLASGRSRHIPARVAMAGVGQGVTWISC